MEDEGGGDEGHQDGKDIVEWGLACEYILVLAGVEGVQEVKEEANEEGKEDPVV